MKVMVDASPKKHRIALLIAGLLGGFLMAELGLRMLVSVSAPNSSLGFVRFMKQQPFPTYRILQNNRLFRPSMFRELVWEPVPNAKRASIRINSGGFRGPETSVQPAPGVRRIAVLGDSETFGEQLTENDTISGSLQQALQTQDPQNRYEVLNFGVIGYNTAQEFALLKRKVVNYKPHVVVLYYVFNDPEIYSPIEFVEPGLFNRAYVYRFFRYSALSLRTINDHRIQAGNIRNYALMLHSSVYFEAVKRILREMAAYAAERDMKLILLIAPEIFEVPDFGDAYPYREIHEKLRNLETGNLAVIDPLPEMEKNFDDPKKLWATPYDPHKNGRANLVIATVAARDIIRIFS